MGTSAIYRAGGSPISGRRGVWGDFIRNPEATVSTTLSAPLLRRQVAGLLQMHGQVLRNQSMAVFVPVSV
jgi:hypothetical protein